MQHGHRGTSGYRLWHLEKQFFVRVSMNENSELSVLLLSPMSLHKADAGLVVAWGG